MYWFGYNNKLICFNCNDGYFLDKNKNECIDSGIPGCWIPVKKSTNTQVT